MYFHIVTLIVLVFYIVARYKNIELTDTEVAVIWAIVMAEVAEILKGEWRHIVGYVLNGSNHRTKDDH